MKLPVTLARCCGKHFETFTYRNGSPVLNISRTTYGHRNWSNDDEIGNSRLCERDCADDLVGPEFVFFKDDFTSDDEWEKIVDIYAIVVKKLLKSDSIHYGFDGGTTKVTKMMNL